MSVIYNTIKIFLPFGEPRGIRVAEGEYNSNIRLIEIPRDKMAQFYRMEEAGSLGIYFLIGKPAAGQQPLLYIGQTRDSGARFKKHEETRSFWQKAFVVVLKNNFRTLDHLAYLEAKAIQTALAAGSYRLENVTAGNQIRHIHDSIRHASEVIFQEIDTLLAVFNQPVFEPFDGIGAAEAPSENSARMLFYCKRHGAEAVGYKKADSNRFMILSGSLFSKTAKTGLDESLAKRRAQWLSDGLLAEHNER